MRSTRFVGLVVFFATFGALAIACGLPDVTFQDLDGAAPGSDGSSATGDGSQSSDDGGGNGNTDSGTPGKDSGFYSKDSGSKYDSGNSCGAGFNEICCGSQVCHGCNPGDCNSCLNQDCPGQGGDQICCVKGGSNVSCHTRGVGGC